MLELTVLVLTAIVTNSGWQPLIGLPAAVSHWVVVT